MYYPRTDLALELHTQAKRSGFDLDGIETEIEQKGDIRATHVKIKNQNGAERLGKPIGNYVTLEMDALSFQDAEQYEQGCVALRDALEGLYTVDENRPVLVVGLGNRFITADALGPKVADRIFVTRHMHGQLEEIFGDSLASVCAVAPGVLGITGVETAEIVQGVCDRIHPGLILVIDALAAREVHRINTTVQICDTGIAPGSGVGNHRVALDAQRFGVPVIAIGVPTVIDAVTMAYDAVHALLHAMRSEAGDTLSCVQNLSEAQLFGMVDEVLSEKISPLTVTPKDVDLAMERISKVLAGGINLYLHKAFSIAEIDSLTM